MDKNQQLEQLQKHKAIFTNILQCVENTAVKGKEAAYAIVEASAFVSDLLNQIEKQIKDLEAPKVEVKPVV